MDTGAVFTDEQYAVIRSLIGDAVQKALAQVPFMTKVDEEVFQRARITDPATPRLEAGGTRDAARQTNPAAVYFPLPQHTGAGTLADQASARAFSPLSSGKDG